MSTYSFQAATASREYHKETTWSNAKVNEKVKIEIETNQSSIAIDPYVCAVIGKQNFLIDGNLLLMSREKFRGISTFSPKKEMEKLLAT